MNIVEAFQRAKKHPDMAAVHEDSRPYRFDGEDWLWWNSSLWMEIDEQLSDLPVAFLLDGWSVVKVEDVEGKSK